MSELLHVSSSPHDRSATTTRQIMADVLIALLPAAVFGVYWFGIHALVVIIACLGASILTEYAYEKAMKKPITVGDGSALVTGLLIALNMPPEIPVFIPVLGSIFAILIVKQIFGGLGQNFMNPALAARCFLLISFAGQMTHFTVDGVSGATPLQVIKEGGNVNLLSMFLGKTGGTIGETCTLAILIGAVYLLIRKVIDLRIPGTYIVTFTIFIALFSGHGLDITYIASQLCGGGLMLGAFFMATDYVTSPITTKGQYIYGLCLGLLTGIFRVYGASAEGVSYAIIFCNLLVPLIERISMPVAFGKEGLKHGKEK